jgi:hypothetical protein
MHHSEGTEHTQKVPQGYRMMTDEMQYCAEKHTAMSMEIIKKC